MHGFQHMASLVDSEIKIMSTDYSPCFNLLPHTFYIPATWPSSAAPELVTYLLSQVKDSSGWYAPFFQLCQSKSHSSWDFPGSAVDRNPPVNAGDGLVPGPGRFHMPSWSNLACVPQLLNPCALEPALCSNRSPLLATSRETPRAATKTQHSQK